LRVDFSASDLGLLGLVERLTLSISF